MAKTLPDLRIVASQIKEATLHGENTADRVGGLLVDLVDYLDTLHIDEVTLGPLLTALNNSNLIDPSDGQTLTFSVIEDNWTFSSAITQLKIAQGRIEMNVASNYQYLLDTKTLLQGELDEADQRIRDNYAEYTTWRKQTDTYIAQYATAYDEEGNLVAMSTIMQTADEVKMEVKDLETKITNIADPESWEQGTTSAEAAGKTYDETKVDDTKVVRIGNLLPVTQDAYLTFTPTDNNYAVQVLYFNKDKVYCTSATHWKNEWTLLSEVEEGKLKIINQTDVQYIAIKLRKGDGSTAITVDDVKNAGLSLATSNVTAYSEFKQTADDIRMTVTDNKDAADEAFDNINNTVIPGLEDEIGGVRKTANNSATWITNNKDRIALVAAQFDENGNLINTTGLVIKADFATLFAQEVDEQGIVHKADLSVYVEHDEDGNIVTGIRMNADQIDMTSDRLNTWANTWNLKANNVNWDVNDYIINGNHIQLTNKNYTDIKTGIELDKYLETADFEVRAGAIELNVSALQEHREDLTNILAWEQGGIDISSPGSKNDYDNFKSSSSKRIRTKELIPISKGDVISINMDASYSVELLFFNKNKKVARPASGAIVHVDWVDLAQQDDHKYEIESGVFSYNVAYVAIVLKINDTTDITVDSIPTSGISIIQQKLVTSGEISLFISKTPDGTIQSGILLNADMINQVADNITLMADQIDFITDGWQIKNTDGMVTLQLDKYGNLTIAGKLNQCELMGDLTVGNTSGNHFMIEPTGDYGAAIVGVSNNVQKIALGFTEGSSGFLSIAGDTYTNITQGSIYLDSSSQSSGRHIRMDATSTEADLNLVDSSGNSVGFRVMDTHSVISLTRRISGEDYGFHITYSDILHFGASSGAWPVAASDSGAASLGLSKGEVYVDTNGFLKIRKN